MTYKAPAIDLNQGQLFRSIRKLAAKNNFDMKILSGKYGLLDSNQIIEPYNQKIRSKKEVLDISLKIKDKIEQVINDYDKIICIMGNNYRRVLESYYNEKFYVVFDKRGIGGYLQLVSKYRLLPIEKLFLELEKFQVKTFREMSISSKNNNMEII